MMKRLFTIYYDLIFGLIAQKIEMDQLITLAMTLVIVSASDINPSRPLAKWFLRVDRPAGRWSHRPAWPLWRCVVAGDDSREGRATAIVLPVRHRPQRQCSIGVRLSCTFRDRSRRQKRLRLAKIISVFSRQWIIIIILK